MCDLYQLGMNSAASNRKSYKKKKKKFKYIVV